MRNMHASMVRVRFAPSPTGNLHVGGLRAVIFNWLFARNQHGKFLLRIEDTDPVRSKPEYTQAIFDALAWMGIDYDEPAVIQSSRLAEHKKIIERLLAEGKVYRCFCAQSVENEESEETFKKYPGTCRHKHPTAEEIQQPHVIRFKVPLNKLIEFQDLIYGRIYFDTAEIDDFVIARTDGTPMYNFVVVVDDAFMRITHIIRGEEHISNTPKQILLYSACGYSLPEFGHLPLILGSDGKKLSKRDAATSVLDYKINGFLPDALFNYLVRLGWSHGDQEVFTRAELIKLFSLEAVGKKGAIFDIKKLEWLNGLYLRQTTDQDILERIVRDIDSTFREKTAVWDDAQLFRLIALYKERAKTLVEIVQEITALVSMPAAYDDEALKLWVTDPAVNNYVVQIIDHLSALESFDATHISDCFKQLSTGFNVKMVALAQPVRIALTGKTTSPGVFDIMAILGKDESLRRIRALQKKVE
jgi:glutamyl-tRNA synthetase